MKVKKLAKIFDEWQHISVIEKDGFGGIIRHDIAETDFICGRYGERKLNKIRSSAEDVLEIEIEREDKKMTLEEAIKCEEEWAELLEESSEGCDLQDRVESEVAERSAKSAAEHRQSATWLKELKKYKEEYNGKIS